MSPAIAPSDAMSAVLAQNWWVVALRGLAAVLFGLIALWMPGAVMLTLALLFAAYLFVDGILGLIASVRAARADERWGWLMVEGILNIVMGLVAAFFPGAAVLAFVLITAAWALLSGGAMVVAAWRLHVSHGRWWLVLGGVVSMLWGVLLVIAPFIGAVVLTWWLGAYALVFGVLMFILAFRLHAHQGEAWHMGHPAQP